MRTRTGKNVFETASDTSKPTQDRLTDGRQDIKGNVLKLSMQFYAHIEDKTVLENNILCFMSQ